MDELEKQIEGMKIPTENPTLQSCKVTMLGLVKFCQKQEERNREVSLLALRIGKDTMEAAIKSGFEAMKSQMNNITQFILDSETVGTLVYLARTTNYDIGYDNDTKCITIFIGKETETEEIDGWITIKEVMSEEKKPCFILDVIEVPIRIRTDFKLPMRFETIESLVDYLKDGNYESMKLGVDVFTLEDKVRRPDNDRGDLTVSGIFTPD